MSSYIAVRIEKPKYFRLAPSRRGRGKRPTVVIGFDSEAENGRPFCLQFSRDGTADDVIVLPVREKQKHAALRVFLAALYQLTPRRDVEYVVFGWNLSYEWTQLFGDLDPDACVLDTFDLTVDLADMRDRHMATYEIQIFNERRYALRIHHVESHIHFLVLDGMAFLRGGLDKVAKTLGFEGKLELSQERKRQFKRSDMDDPEFLAYARNDAWQTRKIGETIIGWHEQYDIRTTLTAPHFSAQVFKRQFLTGEIELPLPEIEQAGLAAYHGGKNGFYLPGPRALSGVFNYDITSAYSQAMRQLPNPVESSWADMTYAPGMHALWCVTMDYTGCRYPGALTHDDRKLTPGHYDALWLTSYELDEIMTRGEAMLSSAHGYAMIGPEGGPLVNFVDTFFAQKAAHESGPLRELPKLLQNSLYGKFFQKVELGNVGIVNLITGEIMRTDPTLEYDYRAGGLYHPPIAGLITGFVRARIHALEHKYESVMTSTDGFFGVRPPDPADIGKTLGALTVTPGDLHIWRERLYAFHPGDGGKRKAALHGFRGDLCKLDGHAARAGICGDCGRDVSDYPEAGVPLLPGTHAYRATETVSLRQAARARAGTRRERAGRFVDADFSLVIEGVAG